MAVYWSAAVRMCEYTILFTNVYMFSSTITYIGIMNVVSFLQNCIHVISTMFASTEFLLLHFSKKTIMIHSLI